MNIKWVCLALALLSYPGGSWSAIKSAAFYYGENPPLDKLHSYNAIIIDPSAHISPSQYVVNNSELYAYVSVGEADKTVSYRNQISNRWLVAKNKIWKADVIDQHNREWQQFFIDKIITPLWNKGYRGFFLDTLDSYQLISNNEKIKQEQITGLINLIQSIKTKYPEAKLILNRGFELLPALHDKVDALAVESLFYGWDQKNKRYIPVPQAERMELLTKLNEAKKFGLPIIVIDYLPPEQKDLAQQVEKQIQALGMIPWISDGNLQTSGAALKGIPRKIYLIYSLEKTTLFDPPALTLLALPLQYMGYQVEYHNVNEPLADASKNDYAGIIVWANPSANNEKRLHDWLVNHLHKIPILFMNSFGFPINETSLAPFGIKTSTDESPQSVHIAYQDSNLIGFETKPFVNKFDFRSLEARNSQVIFKIVSDKNKEEDAIAITPWGGYALYPYVSSEMPNGNNFWIIDPFKWLKSALRLADFPVLDLTTENGRRLMTVHIDGDGFPSQVEYGDGNIAGVELLNRILKKYQIPTSVSVITADISPKGLYPAFSNQFTKVARDIFQLPWIEIASHTFSHPFDWILVQTTPISGKYNLPVPNYRYNPNTEIQGSIDYINQTLAPKDKKCKMIFWSGFANPDEKAVGLTYAAKVGNLNGGSTDITDGLASIIRIGPYGLMVGNYFQVYSAISNEEDFTNVWSGPFYGFTQVIQTFKLTDQPRRIKAIDIYYHFYSATKLASLKALERVYQWALKQPIMNIYASEYFEKVIDANQATITKINDGWRYRTNGSVRELRFPMSFGYPDLARSKNVVGFNQFNDDYYVHLGTELVSDIYFSKTPPMIPYLDNANAKVTQFEKVNNGFKIGFKAYTPIEFQLANMNNCRLMQNNQEITGSFKNNISTYQLQSREINDLQIQCD